MDWFDDEEDEDEEMSSFKDGPYALYPSCSYQTISSFFFDMDFMIYHNLECLFESFDLTLNSLSNAILNMDLENLSFDKSVSKMILKYRHNIFSDIFKQCLNINTTLNTDVSLKEYGSNKTRPSYRKRR